MMEKIARLLLNILCVINKRAKNLIREFYG